MKLFKKVLLVLMLVTLVIPLKSSAANNTVNMYIFYSDTCSHCKALREDLEEVKPKYPNLKIHLYEVTSDLGNSALMYKAAEALDVKITGVPFSVIGTRAFKGYAGAMTMGEIKYAIEVYSKVSSYSDPVGELLGVVKNSGTLTYDDLTSENKEDSIINIPIIGKTTVKDISLPIISIIMGTLDGFNPCAMWVLLFLISMLIGMKDKKRMWILGSSFLITSALVYLFLMVVWINFIGAVGWLKLLIAFVALVGGYLNIRAFARTKEDGCEIVDDTKRKKIFAKIKDFTNQKSFPLALAGVIALAISVNFIELSCSAGFPAVFTDILVLNNLSTFEYSLYLFIYILFFLIDDLIVFFIAMTSLKLTGISTKYGKYSHLIGGIMMLIIGLLMIFKPEWLSFNF